MVGEGYPGLTQAAQMNTGSLISRNGCLRLASQVCDFHLCGAASFLHVTTSALIAVLAVLFSYLRNRVARTAPLPSLPRRIPVHHMCFVVVFFFFHEELV